MDPALSRQLEMIIWLLGALVAATVSIVVLRHGLFGLGVVVVCGVLVTLVISGWEQTVYSEQPDEEEL